MNEHIMMPVALRDDLAIRRVYDAVGLNRIVNDPSVIEWVVPYGAPRPLDLAAMVGDLRNVVLMNAFGGFVCHMHEPSVYEVHTQFLPAGRGVVAVRAAQEALDYMFIRTDCAELTTRIPANNDAARALALAIGFRQDFITPKAWRSGAAAYEDVGAYVLTWRDWLRGAKRLSEHGEWFHDRMQVLIGASSPPHPADPYHDRVVGATILMILGGQLDKALALYNRWARLAGYDAIGLVSRSPLVIENSGYVMLIETEPKPDIVLLRRPPTGTTSPPSVGES